MKLLNNLLDHFNKAEFEVAPNKKLKTISAEFKKAFELSLVFYKGNMLAETDITLASLNRKTSKTVNSKADELKIKGSMKVDEVEKLFDKHFGVTVQIKDATAKFLIPNNITIGQAARKEY
jgi:hypothetical protein